MIKSNVFLRNSFLNFNRNILTIVLGLISTVIIARMLGPEKQGYFILTILLVNLLVTIFNLGIGAATVYYVGQRKFSISTVVTSNAVTAFFLGIISILIGIISLLLFKDTFFEGVPIKIFIIVLSLLPVLFFNAFIQSVFQGLEDFKVFNMIGITGSLINVVSLIITLFILNMNIYGAIFSYIISNLSNTLLIGLTLRRRKIVIAFEKVSLKFIIHTLKYGYKAHLSNIMAFINYRLDILMISFFLSPAAVGIYNTAISVGEKLWVVSQPVSTVIFPRISSLKSSVDRNNLTSIVARNVLALSMGVAVIFYLISDWVIVIMFGYEYSSASTAIKIMLIGITLFSAERILSNDLAGRGKPQLNLYTSVITVIVNVVLNFIFIPRWGINGAAAATSISYSLTFIIKVIIFTKETDVKILSLIVLNKRDLLMYKKIVKGLKS